MEWREIALSFVLMPMAKHAHTYTLSVCHIVSTMVWSTLTHSIIIIYLWCEYASEWEIWLENFIVQMSRVLYSLATIDDICERCKQNERNNSLVYL